MKTKLIIAGVMLALSATAATAAADSAGKTRAACLRTYWSVGITEFVAQLATSAGRVCAGGDFTRETEKLSSRISRFNEKANAVIHKLDSKAPGCDAALGVTTSSAGPFDATFTVAQASAGIHTFTQYCSGP